MQSYLFTRKRGKPVFAGFRGVLAATLLGMLLFATGAKAAPMHGTYSIDASGSGNYTSFSAAAADLKTNGVSGSVVFNVTAATYTETVTVGAITGASKTNNITFRGAGAGQTILTSTGTTLTLTSFTTFDNMTISTTAKSKDMISAGKSSQCGITNCTLSTATGGNVVMVDCVQSDSMNVYRNYFYGGYEDILSGGQSGSAAYGYGRFSHNRFIGVGYCAVYDGQYTYKDSIAFNVIDSAASSTLGYDTYSYGSNGIIIWGNTYYAPATDMMYNYEEDYLGAVSGKPTSTWIVNNFYYVTSSSSYGIYDYCEYDPTGWNFQHNTVYITGYGSVGMYFSPYSATYSFDNNIIYNTTSNYFFEETGFYGNVTSWDGNDFYSTGGDADIYNNNTGYGFGWTYSQYKTILNTDLGVNWDANGTQFKPTFVSTSAPYDLHLDITVPGPKSPFCGIKTDHDQKGRFPTPTTGADEDYYGIVNNNAAVTALLSPYAACAGSVTVSVELSDMGLNALAAGTVVAWYWNGQKQSDVTVNKAIPLYGNDTVVLGTETLVAGVAYTFKAYPTKVNGGANAGGPIDTLSVGGIMSALGSGTYTIDGSKAVSATNFKTFATAGAALNAGVCGPVVFNVSAASYSESISLGPVPGASAVNTVTFNGAGNTKTTLTSGSVPVTLNGSSYITFNNMTIATTGTSTNVINDAASTNCGFISDILTSPNYSGSSGYIVATNGSTGLKVHNCRLVGDYESINIKSSNFDTFTNNRIINSGYYCLYLASCKGNDFEYNVMDSVSDPSPFGAIYDYLNGANTFNANAFYCRNASGSPVSEEYGWYCIEPNETKYTLPGSSAPMAWVFTNNILDVGKTSEMTALYEGLDATGPCISAFNTFKGSGGYYGTEFIVENNSANTEIWASNYMEFDNAADYSIILDLYSPEGFMSGISSWDNTTVARGDTLYDGDDYVSSGSGTWTEGTVTASDFPSLMAGLNPLGYERHGTSVPLNFLNTGANPFYLDTTKASPLGVNICVPVSNSFVNFKGVTTDITGKKRCPLFPTVGAYENPFGKSAVPTKIFLPPAVYLNSPATIYQSHVASTPAVYTWYIKNSNYSSWKALSTSVDLYYSGWTSGTDSLKLVTTSCKGNDSAEIGFIITSPNAVPVTDFIASSNSIQQNGSVQFTDLSSNGPTSWSWAISPDSTTVGSLKYPTTTQYDGTPALNNTQNPSIQFLYPGYYEVCLTAYNGLGKGNQNCKTNYIQVIPAISLSNTLQTLTTPTGYIFDNGGPDKNYAQVGSPFTQSALIAPCADSIYLTFSQFDTKCGADFVRLYNGSDPSAPLINATCNQPGTFGTGPGFNGGPTNGGCPTYCVPNVNKPDTFKAGKTMFLTMSCYTGGAPGFAAYYWVKPSQDNTVAPSFTTASGDTVCAGQIVNYINTTPINPADVPSFEWDLNGDIADGFECVGTCSTALWPYFLPGTVPVTLIAINCGGADTLVQNIVVKNAPKPVAAFSASILAPTSTDVDVFTSTTTQCVDNYKWTITPSAGTIGGAAATFVNGTTNASASPQVTFPDTGYYDVSLYVDNTSATQTNTLVKKKYIHVRDPYCTPGVAQLSSGIGISHVVFNTIDNYTLPQAASGYLNFTTNASLSTDIARGATYPISISRDVKSIFSPINRDVYIDWNQDGAFTGTGEIVATDSNSKSETFTAKIVVPTNATLGATVMRIATNLYLYPNAPCGPNQFGEFQDYRVVVTPYNILPVITLKGVSGLNDTIKVEQGYPYTEPGDSASSYLYGVITKDIVVTSKVVGGSSTFNPLVPGVYVFSYNVTDAANNKAITKYRIVWVTKDVTPPNLVVAGNHINGGDTIYQEVTATPSNLKPSLKSYLTSSKDLVDGDLKGNVVIDSSLVQTAVVGIYPVTYTSEDFSKNTSVVTRYVDVIDTIAPVLTLNPSNPYTVEVYTPYVDPGVTITIPNGYLKLAQVLPYLRVSSSVDDSLLGTYSVTYTLTDTFGNVAKPVTRTVIIADHTAPTITLFGSMSDSIPVFSTYTDPGYTVSDNYTKTSAIKFAVTGTFYSTFPSPNKGKATVLGGGRYAGTHHIAPVYTIVYTATDGSGNTTTVTRDVEVYDATPPTIALIGPPVVTVCRWFPYVDLGYTLSDNYDDSATMVLDTMVQRLDNIAVSGGTNVPNHTMYVQYTAMDQSHNRAQTDYRYITVLDAGKYPCTSGIEPNLTLDKYITIFPNPSSGVFTVDANLPAVQSVRMSVVNMLGQEIAVVHDGNLSNNSFRVDLSTQSSGVYFLKIVTDNQTLTKRIEITK